MRQLDLDLVYTHSFLLYLCFGNVITYSATADELTLTFTLSYNLRQRKRIRNSLFTNIQS